MTTGNKPKFKLTLKSRGDDAKFTGIAAIWEHEGRLSFSFDRDIEAIKLKDGTIIKPGDITANKSHFLNLYGDQPIKKTNKYDESSNTDKEDPF